MDVISKELTEKYEGLKESLKEAGRLAIAFSGGIDSTFLLFAAHEALGENILAITGASLSFPVRELEEATEYCKELGIRQIRVPFEEMKVEGFAENPVDRCYICKKALFGKFIAAAEAEGFAKIAEGSNLDDDGDYRPGMRAIKELGVLSPLRDHRYMKSEIRQMSQHLGIPVWDKPSFACLATRFPYGERITPEKLSMVGAGEEFLFDRGFKQLRVRIHGDMARIELDESEIGRFLDPDMRHAVYDKFRELGFSYISLDLKGYRTGAMNETLSEEILKGGTQ